MDSKIKKLAEFSSIHPARLVGYKKVYGSNPNQDPKFDKIGKYYFSFWEERHPKLNEFVGKAIDFAGPALTLAGGAGLITAGALNGLPELVFPTIFVCGVDAQLTVMDVLNEKCKEKRIYFPLGTLATCCIIIAGHIGYNAIKYVVTLPPKLVAKGVLGHEINKQNKILSLENGAEILENYRAAQVKLTNAKAEIKQQKYAEKLKLKTLKIQEKYEKIAEK